jgi:hypothetical protein
MCSMKNVSIVNFSTSGFFPAALIAFWMVM